MKRIVLLTTLIFMVFIAGAFAQDPVQPEITAPQETKSEVKKADKAKEATVPFTIGEIVVRDRAVPNIEDASTTTVVDGKDVEMRGDKSLADTLQNVSGINVYSVAKGFTGFSLRGSDHQMVSILIDGIPVIEPYYGGNNTDISSIPVSNVSHVVINRGAASALYGALGSVGSINIITKKPEKLTASSSIEYGEHANYMINAHAGAPIGKFYTWVAASIKNSDGYEISNKLDYSARKSWFDKLSSYELYGRDFSTITLKSLANYLNDDNVWNATSYRKYNVSGRLGYAITPDMEAGISVNWYNNEIDSNTFRDNTLAKYDTSTSKWSIPSSSRYTTDNHQSVFPNRAFVWPEASYLSVSPYFTGSWGDLKVRVNTFYVTIRNNSETWFGQDRDPNTTYIFSGSTNYAGAVQSIYEESSCGFFILPTYKIADWNTIAASLHYRKDEHNEYEKAIVSSSLLAQTLGTGEYHTREIGADYITVAVEDQINFKTGVGPIYLSAGISYDAQRFTNQREYNKNTDSLYSLPRLENDVMLWGTRDSLNPVISAVYDPLKDFLRLRTAAAMKTNFPTLRQYGTIGLDINNPAKGDKADIGIKPERIYTFNAGLEFFFLDNTISVRSDYFYTEVRDKIASVYDNFENFNIYVNIDGLTTQGIETAFEGKIGNIAGKLDVSAKLAYIYSHARYEVASPETYGEEVTNTPEQQFIWQFVFDFFTRTSLSIWGIHMRNQIQYVMAAAPQTATAEPFSSSYYKTQELHNPLMLNVKVQQELPFNTYLYVMCKNVLDDYNADPFNPGPGRMFYFGGGGRL